MDTRARLKAVLLSTQKGMFAASEEDLIGIRDPNIVIFGSIQSHRTSAHPGTDWLPVAEGGRLAVLSGAGTFSPQAGTPAQ